MSVEPGADLSDFLYGTDVVNVKKVRSKILLTGTCWYELTGLWHLLSALGYDVYCELPGDPNQVDNPDLIIVALSAEPVAGWGRWICALRSQASGKMLVLVPERLSMLKALQNVCQVYSGCGGLQELRNNICTVLVGGTVRTDRFRLTEGQRWALKHLSEKGRDKPLILKQNEKKLYYHHARLAENVGVRDFRLLLMTGLDRELSSMDKWEVDSVR
ncbi:hypothetical protein EX404_23605 [Salmonella enterica]|nr:hypothetical protein [Salmonella enterica]